MDQSSTNKVILIGRLGQNPEVKITTSGQTLTNISVATSEKFKNQSGEYTEKTEWHRCICWGQTADFVGKYMKKGSLVYIEGKLQTRKWQDKNGIDRYMTEIQVRQLTPLGSKKENIIQTKPEDDDLPDFLKEDLTGKQTVKDDLSLIDDSDIPL